MNENEHKNELELEISTFKPHLRFRIGDLVTLRADLSQSVVFQVHGIYAVDEFADYKLLGVDGKGRLVSILSFDEGLTSYPKKTNNKKN